MQGVSVLGILIGLPVAGIRALCAEVSLLFAPQATRLGSSPQGLHAWAAGPVAMGAGGMAKSKTKSVVLRLMSQAGTGYYYTFRTTMKGVREKCARRNATHSCTAPVSTIAFASSTLSAAATASCTTATITTSIATSIATSTFAAVATATLASASASTLASSIASANIAACALATTAVTATLVTTTFAPTHAPTTVPTEPYLTALHCNPRRSPSLAYAPRPTHRLQLMKHDPVVNKHVLFKEERIKK